MTREQKRLVTAGGVQLEFYDQNIIDLQRELIHPEHKHLREKYGNNRDFSDVIRDLCTEVDIALDGMYTPEDIINLCPKITERLIKKRGGVLVVKTQIGATDV